jgi:hypothetical protein
MTDPTTLVSVKTTMIVLGTITEANKPTHAVSWILEAISRILMETLALLDKNSHQLIDYQWLISTNELDAGYLDYMKSTYYQYLSRKH